MPSIQVRTSQNVMIEYPVASVVDRILATLIDGLLIGAYLVFTVLTLANMNIDPGLAFWVLIYVPVLFYHLVSEVFMNGQSIGKRQMKIRVVKLDGSRPSISSYLVRWILRPIDVGFYGAVAIIMILVSSKGQRLGDLLAGTTVIKLKKVETPSAHPDLFEEDYDPVYPEVFRLTDEEIDLIDKALEYNRKQSNAGPAQLLAEKLAAKMGVKLDKPAISFLHTVKKDYYHVTSK